MNPMKQKHKHVCVNLWQSRKRVTGSVVTTHTPRKKEINESYELKIQAHFYVNREANTYSSQHTHTHFSHSPRKPWVEINWPFLVWNLSGDGRWPISL